MKNLMSLISIGILAVLLSACGKDGGGRPTGTQQGGGYTLSGNYNETVQQLSGQFTLNPISAQMDMTTAAKELLYPQGYTGSSSGQDEIGTVSSIGIIIDLGRTSMGTGQTLDQNYLNQIKSVAQMLIVADDEYSTQYGAQPLLVPMTKGSLVTATLNGTSLNLVFQDKSGRISITGQYSNMSFNGTVSYQNNGKSNRTIGTATIYGL